MTCVKRLLLFIFFLLMANFSTVLLDSTKVAVVTGANQGIGYAIVQGLCKKYDGTVYLTARNPSKAKASIKQLSDLGYKPHFHQLDITDRNSVDEFKEYIKKNHGGIDILINNAAITGILKEAPPGKLGEKAEEIMSVNYFGVLKVCEALFPLLRPNARVIHLSSRAGLLSALPQGKPRTTLAEKTLTLTQLNQLVNESIKSYKKGTFKQDGYGEKPYCISKAAINALASIQQKQFDEEEPSRNVTVNSCNPGIVKTKNNPKGIITTDEGAKTVLYVALEPHNFRGKFIYPNLTVVDWTNTSLHSSNTS